MNQQETRNEGLTLFRRIGLSIALMAVVFALAAGLAVGSQALRPAEAQQPAVSGPSLPRTITVVGEGTVNIEPDMAQANLGVEVIGDSVKEASDEANATMNAVLAALRKLGIADKDIQTSGFSIWTERPYGSEMGPDAAVAYRVMNNVTVTVRQLDRIGDVLDAVIEAGANNIQGVTFKVSQPERLIAEARRLAAENARERAAELAALHGVAVGEVISISEVMGSGVLPNFSRAAVDAGLGGGAVAPGELELTAQLQVVYAIDGPAQAGTASPASIGGTQSAATTPAAGRP